MGADLLARCRKLRLLPPDLKVNVLSGSSIAICAVIKAIDWQGSNLFDPTGEECLREIELDIQKELLPNRLEQSVLRFLRSAQALQKERQRPLAARLE